MQFRKLGKTNYHVSAMGYGAWGIGGKQWLGGSRPIHRNPPLLCRQHSAG